MKLHSIVSKALQKSSCTRILGVIYYIVDQSNILPNVSTFQKVCLVMAY